MDKNKFGYSLELPLGGDFMSISTTNDFGSDLKQISGCSHWVGRAGGQAGMRATHEHNLWELLGNFTYVQQ